MKTKLYLFATSMFILLSILSCTSEDKPLSTENTILSFAITKAGISKEFNISESSIIGKVNNDFQLDQISLAVSIPKGATISPNPSTITSISGPLTFIVTAENGDKRTYNVSIERELSIENSLLELSINTPYFSTNPKIDEQNSSITQRLPEFIDLKNLNIDVKHSKYASISPDPSTIKDYSSPVNFTIKSESGKERIYKVTFEHMTTNRFESCSKMNAWKWFGGDNRTNAPDIKPYDRNVGTGQAILLSKDLTPTTFGIHLDGGFSYFETGEQYDKVVTLKLIIRDEQGKKLATTTTEVIGGFNGGFIPFDLEKQNLFLEADKTYIFYWYLVNGESLGITASSSGNTSDGTGFCFESGYSGESKISKNTSLEGNTWGQHPWHFNIELKGKE
jgi:hypothetical protein